MKEFFERNSKSILQLSGGKDSVACLWLLEAWWDQLTVVWANTGNPYPETVEYMAEVKALVPNFVELKGNQPAYIKEFGYPVDMVPVWQTQFASQVAGKVDFKFSNPFNCCYTNHWKVMEDYILASGVTGIIRGQKEADQRKNQLKPGDVVAGLEFCFPVFHWTDGEVKAFLGDRLPKNYLRGMSGSLDCMNCTAYLNESVGRLQALRKDFPETYAEVQNVHKEYSKSLKADLNLIEVAYAYD